MGDGSQVSIMSIGLRAPTSIRFNSRKSYDIYFVRFGSKADICIAKSNVRFNPESDRNSGHR
jgi:hypothetical protein